MVDNYNGSLLVTVAIDKSMKIFDVVNFGKSFQNPKVELTRQFCCTSFFFVLDMINMIKLDYIPQCVCWIHSSGDPVSALAV